ncbi:response regulator transcription factor [Georgenia yuyongxinii]|uniref:Response regulator transcription factor n=1 Tax=Georgenia yuyongxinii TaxID=2589797 RepID=A0A552WMX0_9MICO|nr:response regulator transcription factor [Georgenia yuyongxinii]TRW43929.1 response regulator transcription factor [Georgenia yuyongxinii]
MSETGEHRTAVVIEDDDDIRGLLVAVLTQAGFTVHSAATGRDGVTQVRTHEPLVTTLDISLPDIDGLEVARRIRMFSPTYLVMLTAHADEVDTLLGLEAGADDYITKPFRPRELRARVEAMLRRPRQLVGVAAADPTTSNSTGDSNGHLPSAVPPGKDRLAPAMASAATVVKVGAERHAPVATAVAPVATAVSPSPARRSPGPAALSRAGLLSHGGLRLDVSAHEAFVDGVEVHLTPTEFSLLGALLRAPGTVVAKTTLVGHLWAGSYTWSGAVADADRRGLEVHMANLRRKLGDDAAHPRFIETVRGVGYRMLPVR